MINEEYSQQREKKAEEMHPHYSLDFPESVSSCSFGKDFNLLWSFQGGHFTSIHLLLNHSKVMGSQIYS
jgi:hypothetical protein